MPLDRFWIDKCQRPTLTQAAYVLAELNPEDKPVHELPPKIRNIWELLRSEAEFIKGDCHRIPGTGGKYRGDHYITRDSWIKFAKEYDFKVFQKPYKQSKRSEAQVERHSKKREEILGAAVAVLVSFPDECTNGKGKFTAEKISEAVRNHAQIIWSSPKDVGSTSKSVPLDPPLVHDTIVKLLNRWINKFK